MTRGQMMFFSGVVLLIATITLAIIFLIKRPRYSPEQFTETGDRTTTRLRNGYPTDKLTKRYSSVSDAPSQPLSPAKEAEHFHASEATEKAKRLSQSIGLDEETERLQESAELVEEVERLQDLSELAEKTERLMMSTEVEEMTEALPETDDLSVRPEPHGGETENLNEGD